MKHNSLGASAAPKPALVASRPEPVPVSAHSGDGQARARTAMFELLEAHDRLYRFASHVISNACDMPGEPEYVIVNRFHMEGLRLALEAEQQP